MAMGLVVLLIPGIAYLSSLDIKYSIAVIAGIIGLALVIACVSRPTAGFYITMITVFSVRVLERLYGDILQVGPVIDILVFSTLLGFIVQKHKATKGGLNYFRDPLLLILYLDTIYLCVEVINPNMYSIAGWVLFIRVYARYTIFLILATFLIRSMADVRKFLKFWLGLSTIAAFYGCIQNVFGLMPFEETFIRHTMDPAKVAMGHGHMRVFSIMSDAAVFGLVMAVGVVICIVFLTASKEAVNFKRKTLLVISAILHLLALAYSGTRTGYIMVPMGFALLVLVNLHNRNTIIAAMVFAVAFMAIIFGPFYGSPTIIRIRTAFIGSKDESLNVREKNRHMVQPYAYSHPIGGGIFTAGLEGETYNPGHPLAGFPPDSGYMRILVEMGWIGLIIVFFYYILAMRYAIGNYFRATTEIDRLVLISIAATLFSIMISQYAQEAAGLMESAVLLNVFVGITVKVRYL